MVDVPEDEFHLLLGRDFLHRNEILVFQFPNPPEHRYTKAARVLAAVALDNKLSPDEREEVEKAGM